MIPEGINLVIYKYLRTSAHILTTRPLGWLPSKLLPSSLITLVFGKVRAETPATPGRALAAEMSFSTFRCVDAGGGGAGRCAEGADRFGTAGLVAGLTGALVVLIDEEEVTGAGRSVMIIGMSMSTAGRSSSSES